MDERSPLLLEILQNAWHFHVKFFLKLCFRCKDFVTIKKIFSAHLIEGLTILNPLIRSGNIFSNVNDIGNILNIYIPLLERMIKGFGHTQKIGRPVQNQLRIITKED